MKRALILASALASSTLCSSSEATAAMLALGPQPLKPAVPIIDLSAPDANTSESGIADIAGIFFVIGNGAVASSQGALPNGFTNMVPSPEPINLAVLGAALTGLGALGWRRRR